MSQSWNDVNSYDVFYVNDMIIASFQLSTNDQKNEQE